MDLLRALVLFLESQRGVASPLVVDKELGLQQSPNCCNMSHLTLNQRYQIWAHRQLKPAQIAKKLGKHRSVITREIERSGMSLNDYSPQKAHQAARHRKANNAQKATPVMYESIALGLQNEWSPQQINGRSTKEGQPMLGTAAIYHYIWRDQQQGGTLYKGLRHASRPYRKRYGKPDGRRKAAKQMAKPSIDQRPVIVETKTRFGDWEIDTVIGPDHKGVLVTLTERSSNYLLMAKSDNKSAKAVGRVVVKCLKNSALPVHTITSDNGTEFADYVKIAKALQTDFFFAHPYHAWERGANEHNNKLIRQYIPKKLDFSQLSANQVESYQERINNRPRKKLNYSTPNEHIKTILSTPFVAFQT